MERDGGIDEVNARLATDFELRADFRAVNAAHGAIRLERTGADLPRLLKELKARFGGSAEAADGVLGSGITGIRAEAVGDAKCLHAHVADRLCRGPGSNAIGDLVLERLAADSIDVLGSDRCFEQCNPKHERTASSWHYTPAKNKQRLRQRSQRRTEQREQQQVRAAAAAAAAAAAE